jgi:hypothetical protein
LDFPLPHYVELLRKTKLFNGTQVAALEVATQTTQNHVPPVVAHIVVDPVQRPLAFVARVVGRHQDFGSAVLTYGLFQQSAHLTLRDKMFLTEDGVAFVLLLVPREFFTDFFCQHKSISDKKN